MADHTKIEWTRSPDGTPGATWNPITGCSRISAGCEHCYAERLAGTRMKNHPSRQGLTRETQHGPVWTGEVRFNEEWLDQPLRWKRPRRIFVCAHSDLFHENVPDQWIDRVFAVAAVAPQHTFILLTKRADRMHEYMTGRHGGFVESRIADMLSDRWDRFMGFTTKLPDADWMKAANRRVRSPGGWPLPNVHAGVSVENQETVNERIPLPVGYAGRGAVGQRGTVARAD